MLMGGGERSDCALGCWVAMDGDVHFVILHAGFGDRMQGKLFTETGGATLEETLASHSSEASDPDARHRATPTSSVCGHRQPFEFVHAWSARLSQGCVCTALVRLELDAWSEAAAAVSCSISFPATMLKCL